MKLIIQWKKKKLFSRIWLFATPLYSLPGSSVQGIFPAIILEWVAIPGDLIFLYKCHCFFISKGHLLPFNVIYERHHDLVESIWTSQSNLGLNSSSSYLPALSLGKLSNLHEPVSSSVNMGLNLLCKGVVMAKLFIMNICRAHLSTRCSLYCLSLIFRNLKWNLLLSHLANIRMFPIWNAGFYPWILKIRLLAVSHIPGI